MKWLVNKLKVKVRSDVTSLKAAIVSPKQHHNTARYIIPSIFVFVKITIQKSPLYTVQRRQIQPVLRNNLITSSDQKLLRL